MPTSPLKFSLFSLTILLFSTQVLLITCSIPRQSNFPKQISIPQYHNYSIEFSACYTPGFSSLLINGKESSPFIKLEVAQKDVYRTDTFAFYQLQIPSIIFDTSSTGNFKAQIQTFENNNPICDFELTVTIFDGSSEGFPSVLYNDEATKLGEKFGLLKNLFPESVLTASLAKDFLQSVTKNEQKELIFTQDLSHLIIKLGKEKLLSAPAQADRASPDLMFYIQSLDSNVLSVKTCAFNEKSWDCVSTPVINLSSKVTSFAALSNSFIAFITEDAPNDVQVYKVYQRTASATLIPSTEMSCNSVLPSQDPDFATLYCVSTNSVTVWGITLGSVAKQATLDASSLGLADFQPLSVLESPTYPSTLFIKTSESIVIARHYNLEEDQKVELLSEIQVPTEEGDFAFTVTGDQLIILTSNKGALQYSIGDLEMPRLINNCFACHNVDNLDTEGMLESSGYPLFAAISNTNVNIYHLMLPGFMYTFSSIKLNSPSKIMKIVQADRWTDLMVIYSAEANEISFYRIHRQPRYVPTEEKMETEISTGNNDQAIKAPVGTSKKPVSSHKDNKNSSFSLMVPQGYSPIGFALFIISIAYIVIIFIFIARRVIKTRRQQRIADENAILLPEGEGEAGDVGGMQGDLVEEHMNNNRASEEEIHEANDGNRYVAINNDDSTRLERSGDA